MVRTVLPLFAVLTLVHSTANAQLLQDPTTVLTTQPTLVNGLLTIGGTTFQTDEASSREELPGLGHKFELFGTFVKDTDPDPFQTGGNSGNSGGGAGNNEVISATVTPGSIGLAYRKLNPGIGIRALTNQIGLKYYFEGMRTCGGGSPRVQLFVDANGDGISDFTAHGHVNPPVYVACPTNQWKYEDLTDNLPRWEVTDPDFRAVLGFPVFPFNTWQSFVTAIEVAFPAHRVLAGALTEDSCPFPSASCGKAYYDLLTIENRTLEIWQDAVKK